MAGLSYDQEKEITRQLLDMVHGHWDEYLPYVIPELVPAIHANGKHVTCILPGHGGENDMRIRQSSSSPFRDHGCVICTCTSKNPIRSGLDLIQRVRGCDFRTARDLLLDAVGGKSRFSPDNPPQPYRRPEPTAEEIAALKAESDKVKRQITDTWNATISIFDPKARPARLWFKRRHLWPLSEPMQDMRFHPALMYYDHKGKPQGKFPALVAMVRGPDGKSRTINRTYITETGTRAPFEDIRKLHSVPNDLTASGGAVQIDDPTYCLNIAEGIETALAVRSITGLPTWATLTKDLLANVQIPESVKIVTVWADKDRSDSGQEAAAKLVLRLRKQGLNAVALLPPIEIPDNKKGIDWNDMVELVGVRGIQNDLLYRQWLRAFHAAEASQNIANRQEVQFGA